MRRMVVEMSTVAASAKHQNVIYGNKRDFMLASCGPVFIVEWRVDTTMEGCRALRTECERFGRTQPAGVGLLTIINANAPAPGAPERVAIADFLRAGSSYIKSSAVVVEGQGFRAALVRGVVTGLTLLAKQAFPHRVVTMPEAMQMLSDGLGQRGAFATQLDAEIARLRARALAELGPKIIAA
jgi:hypothetical protein